MLKDRPSSWGYNSERNRYSLYPIGTMSYWSLAQTGKFVCLILCFFRQHLLANQHEQYHMLYPNVFLLFDFSVLNNIFYVLPLKINVFISFVIFLIISAPFFIVSYSFHIIHDRHAYIILRGHNSYESGMLSQLFNTFKGDYFCFSSE